jgi:two-component system, sensor histidine kinase YesM
MKSEVGKTMLQLIKQNHMTLEKTLVSVSDKTVTFLDNQFFSDAKQLSFWTEIETVREITEADSILERWSTDGTEYSLWMPPPGLHPMPQHMRYKDTGFMYSPIQGQETPTWAEQALQEKGAGTLRLTHAYKGLETVSFIRCILQPQQYDKPLGFLVVSRLEALLMKDLSSVQLPENARIYLLNQHNELLLSVGDPDSESSDIPEKLLRGSSSGYDYNAAGRIPWLYVYSYKEHFNTRLIYKIPVESITGSHKEFQWMMMVLSAIYLLFVLMFVLYLMRNFVKPLGKRLDQSIEENYGMRIRQKEMELTTLHSQITPHLLYNTLDSIYWYAIDSGNRGVGVMVKDLSKLLRIGLSKGKSIISVQEELEHVQAYIRLQMERYPDTFEVQWDIDEQMLRFGCPKVIIQPLVENSILHGVSSMDGEGMIWIRVQLWGQEIHIVVEDNGYIRTDTEKLDLILDGTWHESGYGIRNVHQRIQLHYGKSFGLHYKHREGGGLIATIVIPALGFSE